LALFRLILLAAVSPVLSVPRAEAQQYTWDAGSGTNADWGVAANWQGDTLPTFGTSTDIVFSGTMANNGVTFLGAAPRTIRDLTFAADAPDTVVIRPTNTATTNTAQALTFSSSTGTSTITVTSGTLEKFIGVTASTGTQVILNSALVISNSSQNSLTLDGIVGGTGSLIINTGTLRMSGTNGNTFSGSVSVNGGVLDLAKNATGGAGLAIANGATVTVSSGTLLLSGSTNNVNRIADAVPVHIKSGGMFDLNGRRETLNNITLGGGSIQTSTGTLSLGGNLTYDNTGNPIGSTISGNLVLGNTTSRIFDIGDSSGASADLTVSAVISGTGILKTGSGTLVFTGTNTYTGTTNIGAGTLQIGDGGSTGALATTSTITGSSGATLVINRSNTGSQGAISGELEILNGRIITGAINFTQAGTGTTILSLANTYTGTTTVTAGELKIAQNNAISSGPLVVNGGVFNLQNFSDTVGAVTLTSGTISSSTGVLTGASYTVQSGLVSAILAGSGTTLTKSGAGTVTLSAANTYTGLTTISEGTLTLGHGTDTLDGAVTINGGTLDVANPDTVGVVTLISGTISGAGTLTGSSYAVESGLVSAILAGSGTTLTKSGAGTVTLSAANTYTGLTTVSAGQLQLGAGSTTGALSTNSTISIDSGATFAINRSNMAIQGTDFSSAAITGAGNFAQIGTGTTILTAANTYTGATTITSGRLVVDGSLAAGSAVTTGSTATLAGSGTIGGATTIQGGGIHSPGNSPGIQTFSGDLTYGSGSIFEWEMDMALVQSGTAQTNRGTAYDGVNVGGTLGGSGAIFRIVINEADFTNAFWDQNRTWENIFTQTDGTTPITDWAAIFGGGFEYYNGATPISGPSNGSFSISGNTLSYTVIPEPSNLLTGLLLLAGMWHRGRRSGGVRG
jgi:fibronectin-binding autotransporter adhesin